MQYTIYKTSNPDKKRKIRVLSINFLMKIIKDNKCPIIIRDDNTIEVYNESRE